MKREQRKLAIAALVIALLLAVGGVAWWGWTSVQRDQRVAQADYIMTEATDPSVSTIAAEVRWDSARNELAAQLHQSPDWLKQELQAGLDDALARAEDTDEGSKGQCWREAGDLALALFQLDKAGECYRNAVEGENKVARAEAWATATARLALVLHLTGKFDVEYALRKQVADSLKDSDDNRYADALIRLASAEIETHRLADAEQSLTKALAIKERLFSADSPEMLSALNPLSITQNLLSEFDDSEKTLQRGMTICEHNFGPDHWRTAYQFFNLEGLARYRGRWNEAVDYGRRAVDISEKAASSGNNGGEMCKSIFLFWLGANLNSAGKYAEAEPLLRRALEIDEKILPHNHLYIAHDLKDLGHAMQGQNRFPEAEALYTRATEIAESAGGVNSTDFADCLMSLGAVMMQTHPPAEAELVLRRAVAVTEAAYGAKSARTGDAQVALARVLEKTGQLAESKALMDKGTQILTANKSANGLAGGLRGPSSSQVEGLVVRGESARQAGNLVEAEALLRQALKLREAQPSNDSGLEIAVIANNLGLVLQDGGQYAEAEDLYRRSMEINTRVLGPKDVALADNLLNLAILDKLRRRPQDALPLARQALAIYEEHYGKSHARVGTALNNLAAILQDLRRLDEAEPLARQALAIDEATYGSESRDVMVRLDRLGSILEDKNQPKAAEPVLRRLLLLTVKLSPATGATPKSVQDCVARYGRCLVSLGQNQGAIDERIGRLRRGEQVPDL
jgi:tetratricopeptide (TPR) repeat protein